MQTTVYDWIVKLPDLIHGYAPYGIDNMDETGLFFHTLPDKSFNIKREVCTGGKLSKYRLTVALCCMQHDYYYYH